MRHLRYGPSRLWVNWKLCSDETQSSHTGSISLSLERRELAHGSRKSAFLFLTAQTRARGMSSRQVSSKTQSLGVPLAFRKVLGKGALFQQPDKFLEIDRRNYKAHVIELEP
jgi:hypothetical protein